MKAIIDISKNESLKAGIDNDGGEHIVIFNPVDLTQEQRDELAVSNVIFNHNSPQHGLYRASRDPDGSSIVAPAVRADIETLKMLLDVRIEIRHKRKVKEKEKRKGILDKFLKADISNCYWINRGNRNKVQLNYTDIDKIAVEFESDEAQAKIIEALTAGEKEAEARKADNAAKKIRTEKEHAERMIRYAAEKKQEETDRLKKKEQIVAWVAEKGTESQKARLAENLLPEKEIIDAIRDEAYRPLDNYERYEKIITSDVCDCEYDYCNVEFDANNKHEATENEFDLMQEFKKLMPGSTVTIREHKGESECCEKTVTRTGIMVKVTVRTFNFSREYAI